MATAIEIMALRRMTGELVDAEPYTDVYMSDTIDSSETMDQAALAVWEFKAASSATFVDTQESGSSRRLSQIHDQNLKMVALYRGKTSPETQPGDLTGYAYTTAIERV